MRRRYIKANVLKVLFAHSGNQCAYPGCCLPIFEDNNQLTGECCHIEAYSKNGPRYNPALSDEKCNEYENLILLCSRHHKIIDGDPQTYTVNILQNIKGTHEKKYSASHLRLSETMISQLRNSTQYFWDTINKIHTNDTTGLHREIDPTISLMELVDIVDKNFNEIEEFVKGFETSDAYLVGSFYKLCKQFGWDVEKIYQLPYYENPLHEPNWEMHNLGRPNIMNNARMHYYCLVVKMLEQLSLKDCTFIPLLEKWRSDFFNFQQNNHYVD